MKTPGRVAVRIRLFLGLVSVLALTLASSGAEVAAKNWTASGLIPEPTTAALVGLGLLGLLAAGQRRSA
jgi:hypothetical protein